MIHFMVYFIKRGWDHLMDIKNILIYIIKFVYLYLTMKFGIIYFKNFTKKNEKILTI